MINKKGGIKMGERKSINDGYQPRQANGGYQPREQRGFQPQPQQSITPSNPPSGGSNVRPASNGK
jgi:hypothetical protein